MNWAAKFPSRSTYTSPCWIARPDPIPDEVPMLQQRGNSGKATGASPRACKVGGRHQSAVVQQRREDNSVRFGEGYKLIIPKKSPPSWNSWRSACRSGPSCVPPGRARLHFGLAWRTQAALSWVQHAYTFDGQRRDWAVLVGMIMSHHKHPSTLEFSRRSTCRSNPPFGTQ